MTAKVGMRLYGQVILVLIRMLSFEIAFENACSYANISCQFGEWRLGFFISLLPLVGVCLCFKLVILLSQIF